MNQRYETFTQLHLTPEALQAKTSALEDISKRETLLEPMSSLVMASPQGEMDSEEYLEYKSQARFAQGNSHCFSDDIIDLGAGRNSSYGRATRSIKYGGRDRQ